MPPRVAAAVDRPGGAAGGDAGVPARRRRADAKLVSVFPRNPAARHAQPPGGDRGVRPDDRRADGPHGRRVRHGHAHGRGLGPVHAAAGAARRVGARDRRHRRAGPLARPHAAARPGFRARPGRRARPCEGRAARRPSCPRPPAWRSRRRRPSPRRSTARTSSARPRTRPSPWSGASGCRRGARDVRRVQRRGKRGGRRARRGLAGGRGVARVVAGAVPRRRDRAGDGVREGCCAPTTSWRLARSRRRPARAVDARQITFYKSVGVAVEDAAAAALVLEAARVEGAGTDVAL